MTSHSRSHPRSIGLIHRVGGVFVLSVRRFAKQMKDDLVAQARNIPKVPAFRPPQKVKMTRRQADEALKKTPPLELPPMNSNIKVSGDVRLIDEEGTNLGLVSMGKALQAAREKKLELVQVNPTEDAVAICKIMSMADVQEIAKKKQAKSTGGAPVPSKVIECKPTIAPNDLTTKINAARRALKREGVLFHVLGGTPANSTAILERVAADCADIANTERWSQHLNEGKCHLVPKKVEKG